MATKIRKITRQLRDRRKALLQAYDDEELHQLRVTIRRIRGLLKQHTDPEARELRKSWELLARNTNAARDWDTLAMYAADTLKSDQWAQLQPLINEHRAEARGRVLGTLESGDWEQACGRWERFVARAGKDSFSADHGASQLARAAERAVRASLRALARGDESSWHKLRIRIKNLRYLLDNADLTRKADRERQARTLKLCKTLQDDLGDWHDTVVHRGLLLQLTADPRAASDPACLAVLEHLQVVVRERGAERLQHIREELAEQAEVLAAAGQGVAGMR